MNTLYTIELNHKHYQTTRQDKAWDFCTRFGAQVIDKQPTAQTIDGIELIERSWVEILHSMYEWLKPSRLQTIAAGTIREDKTKMDGTGYISFGPGHLQEFQYPINGKKPEYFRIGEEPRYRITEWPQDGD